MKEPHEVPTRAARFVGWISARAWRPLWILVALVLTVVTVSVFAEDSSGGDLPPWAAVVIAIISSGGITAAITHVVTKRATAASADKTEADALSTSVETIGDLLDKYRDVLNQLIAAQEESRTAGSRAAAAEAKADDAITRCRRVEEIAALAIAANRMEDLEEFADFWDLLPIVVVFTQSEDDGGRFTRVNTFTCQLLQCRKEDLLGFGWQDYLSPADREITRRAEASAHRRRVWGFANHYITREGTIVEIEWYAPIYRQQDKTTVGFGFPVPCRHHATAYVPAGPMLPMRRANT